MFPLAHLLTIYKYDSASNKLSPHKITQQHRIITHNLQRLKKKVYRFVVVAAAGGIMSIIVDSNRTQQHYESLVVDPFLSRSRSHYVLLLQIRMDSRIAKSELNQFGSI